MSDQLEQGAGWLTVDSVEDEAAKAIPRDRLLKAHVFAKRRKTAQRHAAGQFHAGCAFAGLPQDGHVEDIGAPRQGQFLTHRRSK